MTRAAERGAPLAEERPDQHLGTFEKAVRIAEWQPKRERISDLAEQACPRMPSEALGHLGRIGAATELPLPIRFPPSASSVPVLGRSTG